MRLSNFMMWQSAYSEFAFVKETWPDFTLEVYQHVLSDYQTRTRRYGAVV